MSELMIFFAVVCGIVGVIFMLVAGAAYMSPDKDEPGKANRSALIWLVLWVLATVFVFVAHTLNPLLI